MTMDINVYDDHAEALIRFATVLVGPESAVVLVTTVLHRAAAHQPLRELQSPRIALMRRVLRLAEGPHNRRDTSVLPAWRVGAPLPVPLAGGTATPQQQATDAILLLSLRRRAAVYLVYSAGLDSSEAARVMRVPSGVVRRHLMQAGKQCRAISPANAPWFRRRFRDAMAPLVAATPRMSRLDLISHGPTPVAKWRRISVGVRIVAVLALGVAIVGTGAVLLNVAQVPAPEGIGSVAAESDFSDDGIRIVAPDAGPDPGPLAPCCADRPFGVGFVVGRDDVTLALRNQLSAVVDQISIPEVDLSDVALWPAAVIRDDLYTIVARDDVPIGVIKTTEAAYSGFGSGAKLWLDVVTRKNWGWITSARVVWSALPADAAIVRVTIPDGRNLLQRPVGRTAFFDLATPGWNQIARFTALNAAGSPLSVRTLELDGGGCSGRLAQIPFIDRSLPDEVSAVRLPLLDAAIRCDAGSIEQILRDHPGTVISLNAVDRIYGLARLDMVYPIMWDIGRALKEPWVIERDASGEFFVWSLVTGDDVVEVRVPRSS